VKPREARRAATLVAAIGDAYEEAGRRKQVTVYFNGGTMPGEKDRVYMEWVEDTIETAYRPEAKTPERGLELGAQLRELQESSWIEFYELMTPDKAVDLDA
jgi:hypothetical protein